MYSYTEDYLTKDGRPWFPVMGEFHFTRYPRQYWKEAVQTMKAGGIDILSCYCIWIHHEEKENVFDFTGDRSLRDFLAVCQECQIKVFLRIGPWAHGEVRNGGFPDWLLEKNIPLRQDADAYLFYANRYYRRLGEEARGFMDKDGGPVIGVQIENEYGHVGGLSNEEGQQHMRTLKRLAAKAGFQVPYYTATAWGGACTGGMLPVMGCYCDAPWDQRITELEPSVNYLFSSERNDSSIASDHAQKQVKLGKESRFPYLTAELGGGLQVTYHRRPIARGQDIGAMSMVRMGSGCNLLGYYMYHGGTNPEGRYTTLQETRATGYPNDLPVKSYDFNAPVREFGQLSDSFREIRMLSLFVHDFGEDFCKMEPEFPEGNPEDATNLQSLRYCVRCDEKGGYVFVNNFQRRYAMADHTNVSLTVRIGQRAIALPSFSVRNGEFFFFPVNMPIGKALLRTALCTPLCRIDHTAGCKEDALPLVRETYVFYGDREPQFQVEGDTEGIRLLHLSREQALNAAKVRLDREYLVIADCAVIPCEEGFRLRGERGSVSFDTCPRLSRVPNGFTETETEQGLWHYQRDLSSFLADTREEVFLEELYAGEDITEDLPALEIKGIRPDIPKNSCREGILYRITRKPSDRRKKGTKIGEWKEDIQLTDRFLIFRIAGDRYEIFQENKLISDGFYTGQKCELGLKRFQDPTELLIKVYAYYDQAPIYLEKMPACRIEKAVSEPQWGILI